MRRSLVRTICFAVVLLSVVAVGFAGDRHDCTCSYASVKGPWGYSESGTLYLPTTPPLAVPYASVGSYTVDRDGNLSGARTASRGGTIETVTIQGTATVNPDCTGILTLKLYDASNNLVNTVVKFVVYVDDSTAARSIITSVTLPNGVTVPTVLVTDAKKMFPGGSDEHGR